MIINSGNFKVILVFVIACICFVFFLGMSAAPIGYIGKVLEGFKLSTATLKPKQTFPPPALPRDYKPFRKRPEADGTSGQQSTSGQKTVIGSGAYSANNAASSNNAAPGKKKIDANVRSAMLGELGMSKLKTLIDRTGLYRTKGNSGFICGPGP